MRIQFWGVRGSLPAPQLPSQIKSKISAIMERISPEDIASPESRERFLAELPPWLFGTVGGNTPCVSLTAGDTRNRLVFDCGSGLRELGNAVAGEQPKPLHYDILLSHLHWDHLQGLPFFGPAYDPAVSLDFYSPMNNLENALNVQMSSPYFPVHMQAMGSRKDFHLLEGPIELGDMAISYFKNNHPGNSYSFLVNDGKHRFIYATDTELSPADFIKNEQNAAFFENADMIVLDSQYTLGEAIQKYNWGHSAFSMGVDFAANWGIKHLVLFHHDPTYDDRKLFNILQSARWYTERMNIKGIKISLAMEGMEIIL
ncbi:metallo-beta-lactamase family protein [Treponema primitia ZAS-2]|uniref:Metallo-beta-lactamase family protein n=1 Tax=Treponema primitia (strain ATCC BAA-887 / DSM 12427 / ZAS-2) TaxID=545694 RepID=F5YHY8_TREPZ|nr:MBL fold metallo-hydrolase [Treponema primitia]AEF85922.1 metallo-beta-lactamase family protein [Treponema primitia ZAS-2]